MNRTDAERIKERFSTVYITIVSIFLGLAMEDLFSKFASIENPDFYSYVILLLVSLLVINLWIAYSNIAISVRLIPNPMDAFMVFGSIMGLYLLNFMIFRSAYEFFYIHGAFNLGAALATVYHIRRALTDEHVDFDPHIFRPVYGLNIAIFAISICVGVVLQFNLFGKTFETFLAGLVLLCPIAWLWVFWAKFKRAFPAFNQHRLL